MDETLPARRASRAGAAAVDLWYALSRRCAAQGLLEHYRALLTPDERERERSFAFEEDRRRYLVGRALLRTALSSYTEQDPRSWRFARGPHGKPSIDPASGPPLRFSLARSGGMVACGVTRGCDLGVDVEQIRSILDARQIARHFFNPSEIAALDEAGDAGKEALFFQLWTLKEALGKAVGSGLSQPLGSFSIDVRAGRASLSSHAPNIRVDDWQFVHCRLIGAYQLAIAIHAPAGERLSIRLREAIPLRWQSADQLIPSDRWPAEPLEVAV